METTPYPQNFRLNHCKQQVFDLTWCIWMCNKGALYFIADAIAIVIIDSATTVQLIGIQLGVYCLAPVFPQFS